MENQSQGDALIATLAQCANQNVPLAHALGTRKDMLCLYVSALEVLTSVFEIRNDRGYRFGQAARHKELPIGAGVRVELTPENLAHSV